MNNRPKMPELSDERRWKLVKYYEDYVNKAIAKLEEWYPDRWLDPVPVKHAHDSFVSELTKVAIEIGYKRWPWLAAAYGFHVVHVKAPEKIDIEANAESIALRTWDRFVENAIPTIDGLYPDGVIVDFRKDHGNSCKRTTFYAKKLGYPTWGDLLVAAGYDVRDSFRSREAVDIDEINRELDELAARYRDNPAPTIQQVIEEADSRQLRALDHTGVCNRLFGMTMAELFEQRGIIVKSRRRPLFSDEEQLQALDALKARYADKEEKPATLAQLRDANDDLAAVIDYMGSGGSCTSRVFGVTFVKHLKSIGVLTGKRSQSFDVDAEACEAIVNRLKEKYAHAPRPRSAAALKRENEEYALHEKEVNKWIKVTYGQTFPEFVKDQQLVSAVSRLDFVPRPSDKEIASFYDEISLDGVLAAVESSTDGAVVRFRAVVTGKEERNEPKNFEMLRVGDYIAFELLDSGRVLAVFCDHGLGLLSNADDIEHCVAENLNVAEAGVLVGDRVYARVTQISGGQKKPSAALDVFYAKNSEGLNIVNDVLLSRDGKKALRYLGDGDVLEIPEGVEVVRADAFYKLGAEKVVFPSTLREIGKHAFGLCACREYCIPAGVEKIGEGPFSFCFKSVLQGECVDWVGSTASGPVRVEVEEGNARYYSVDGSLIERNGDQRRLLSLWYDGAPQHPYDWWNAEDKKLDVTIPDGVTALAPHCVSATRGYSFNLTLPGSLTTVEKQAFVTENDTEVMQLHFSSINVPAGLVDVSIDFWDSCAEDPVLGLVYYDDIGMEPYKCSIRIDPENPRFLLVGQTFYDKTLLLDETLLNMRPSGEYLEPDCSTASCRNSGFSIDGYDFAPKMFSVESLTFAEGNRALGPEFSVVAPDGWRVFNAREEGERPFRAYADESVLWDDIDEGEYAFDGMFYCQVPGTKEEDLTATLQRYGIDEIVRAYRRSLLDGDANFMAARIKRFDIARGKNCYVMVADDRPYDEGYCIQIWPCMPFSSDYVRLNCPNQSSEDADAAFEKALEIAKTVEVTHPLVCDVIAAVQKCASEKVDAKEFVDAVWGLVGAIDSARALEREAVDQRFLREAKQEMTARDVSHEELMRWNSQVIIDYLSDFSERVIHYVFELVDAYAFQKANGASQDELQKMIGIVNDAMELFDIRFTDRDPSVQAVIDALGNVRRPGDWSRLRAMIDAEMRALGMEVPEERGDGPDEPDEPDEPGEPGDPEELGEPDDPEEPNKSSDPDEPDEPDVSEAPELEDATDVKCAPVTDRHVDERERAAEDRVEGPRCQIDQALFAMTMLSGDWIWFNPTQIGWDGERHVCAGADINALKISEFGAFLADAYPGCFASMYEARSFFVKLARDLEHDESLRVPRQMIAPGLHEALREGDLTGLTLLNLAACGGAIVLRRKYDDYLLIYDSRLANGIPGFFDLCARMVWDLRAMVPGGEGTAEVEPFTLTFAGARNFDADEFLGDVRVSVAGAQKEPTALRLSGAPQVRACASQTKDTVVVQDDLTATEQPVPAKQPITVKQTELPIEKSALDLIAGDLPDQLVDCLAMCLRNVVGFDFFAATFDRLKEVSLADLDAAGCKTACNLTLQALRAQAFKGVDAEDLELMQLEAESLLVELNSVHGFDLQGAMLLEAQKSGAEEFAVGRETQAAGTQLVDALSQVYWSAATQLVDVLIEVVYAKSKFEYKKDFESWKENDEELRGALAAARDRKNVADLERLNASKREKDLSNKVDKFGDAIFDIAALDNDIEHLMGAIMHCDKFIEKKEEELAALKAWSFIQRGMAKEEIDSKKKEREKSLSSLSQLRKQRRARIDSFEIEGLTLDQLRSLKKDAEAELALANDEVARCSSRYSAAKDAADEASRDVNGHILQRPDEWDYPHKHIRQLLWRPVLSAR